MRPAGFTLVEMMVVLGLVAILVLMALPSYTDKFIKEQVLEALPLADIAKPPVALAWSTDQKLPASNADAGLPAADKIVNNIVTSVQLKDGAINITFGNKANAALKGKVLSLRPAVVEDSPIVPITWLCGMASPPPKMTAKGENRTDIPINHLPLRCRQ